MNTRIHKGLAVVAMLFGLVFVATNAVAKKPTKPPPDPDPVGTCETSKAFSFGNPITGPAMPPIPKAGNRRILTRILWAGEVPMILP